MTVPVDSFDLLVVGGGINGAGIANDAAGRGLRVALVEQNDLASATSSASSKLIHGGLRYLEHYEFRLVQESLAEREILLRKAPHIVRPLRFVFPHRNSARPAWLVRLGLFLYDHLARHPSLPNSRSVELRRDPAGQTLKDRAAKAFEYFDCSVDDARLVILNAVQAAEFGARIMTRTRLVSAERGREHWRARVEDGRSGRTFGIAAKALINVTGPWAQSVADTALGMDAGEGTSLKLINGSHIVVPRLYEQDHAYTLQNTDGRVVFVIPFLGRFSLIGTTEVPFEGDAASVAASDAERDYLLNAVNGYFAKPVEASDVIWTFAGVRPLFGEADSPSAISRDYVLLADIGGEKPPLITVYGGKITTYRRLAEKVMAILKMHFPKMGRAWTSDVPLPGGDVGSDGLSAFTRKFVRERPELDPAFLKDLAGRYGALAPQVLGPARRLRDLGRHFGGQLYQCEVDYLAEHEWAQTADDVLWRRTKAGLTLDGDAREALAEYMAGPNGRGGGGPGDVWTHAAP